MEIPTAAAAVASALWSPVVAAGVSGKLDREADHLPAADVLLSAALKTDTAREIAAAPPDASPGFTIVKALTIATRVPLPSCSVSPMRETEATVRAVDYQVVGAGAIPRVFGRRRRPPLRGW